MDELLVTLSAPDGRMYTWTPTHSGTLVLTFQYDLAHLSLSTHSFARLLTESQ